MNANQHLDHEALAELKEVMDDDFQILISTFLSDSRERVRALREALEHRDSETFAKAAHSFKGSCINIGAPRLGQLCLDAERQGRSGDLSDAPALLDAIESEFESVDHALMDYVTTS